MALALLVISFIGEFVSFVGYFRYRVALLSLLRAENPQVLNEIQKRVQTPFWVGIMPSDNLLDLLDSVGPHVSGHSRIWVYKKRMQACQLGMLVFGALFLVGILSEINKS